MCLLWVSHEYYNFPRYCYTTSHTVNSSCRCCYSSSSTPFFNHVPSLSLYLSICTTFCCCRLYVRFDAPVFVVASKISTASFLSFALTQEKYNGIVFCILVGVYSLPPLHCHLHSCYKYNTVVSVTPVLVGRKDCLFILSLLTMMAIPNPNASFLLIPILYTVYTLCTRILPMHISIHKHTFYYAKCIISHNMKTVYFS